MENLTYIIQMPGKPPREVTNINFVVVVKQVEALGGTIYLKPLPPQPEPPVSKAPMVYLKPVTEHKTYTWNEVMKIANEIRDKYFYKSDAVMNCPVKMNTRLRKSLGRAFTWIGRIELSQRLSQGITPTAFSK